MSSNLSVFSSEFRGVQSFEIADNHYRNRLVLGLMPSLDLIFENTGYFMAHSVPSCVNGDLYFSQSPYQLLLGLLRNTSLDTVLEVGGVWGSFFAFLFCYFLGRLLKTISAICNPRFIFPTKSN